MGVNVTKAARKLHRNRNSIINEAGEEWLERHCSSEWPKGFFNFNPLTDIPDFHALRKNLKNKFSKDSVIAHFDHLFPPLKKLL